MTETPVSTTPDGVAIDGYDTVAYFTDGEARPGSPAHAHAWNGATWWFASAEHAERFAAEPTRYAPRFGGHCAFGRGVAGRTVPASPTAWRMIDGRLYLMMSGPVRAVSRLFTGRIARAAG